MMKSDRSSRMRFTVGLSMLTLIAIVGTGFCVWQAQAADDSPDPDLSLRTFMRKKLDASSLILEGLTTEDSTLIEKGADALKELSKAEKWNILTDSEYRSYTIDFRFTITKLADAAEKGNFDNAALQWIDAMKGCIECHQHVRRERASKKQD